jgi:hypothetical protein
LAPEIPADEPVLVCAGQTAGAAKNHRMGKTKRNRTAMNILGVRPTANVVPDAALRGDRLT